jgi:dTDP-4-amino-4,6-dideoxygalactose transaminase
LSWRDQQSEQLATTKEESVVNSDWPNEYPGINWVDREEEEAVLDVIRKGALFRFYGPATPTHVRALEARAREFYGTQHAMAVNSGTGALFAAMSALGIGPGCEVIIPAFLWVATATAVVRCNAIPVVCEVDDSFNMNPEDLAKKITPRTRLIAVIHMAGAPADMDAIMQIADQHGIDVLEDCAQCNGGSYKGQKVGTFGRVGTFSFQTNKNATAGEGGLVITNDEQLHERVNAVHDLGVPWHGTEPTIDSSTQAWGHGRRMSELTGAVANVQLKKLSQITSHMRASKMRIRQRLLNIDGVRCRRLIDAEGDTGPFLIFSLDSPEAAQQTLKRMQEKKIAGAAWFHDFGLHIYYNIRALTQKVPLSPCGEPWSLPQNAESVYEYHRGACPESDRLFQNSVILPIPSRLNEAQEQELGDMVIDSLAVRV